MATMQSAVLLSISGLGLLFDRFLLMKENRQAMCSLR